jgi:3-hydroxyisobutyrate dehydrogenase-like beta-hydroxyacid dehydrogenase
MTETHPAVAVLGLGALGSPVARALLEAGHPTTVWNRTPERADAVVRLGAASAATPAEAVAAARVVLVAVADDDAVRAVLDPVAADLAGRVVVNLTSGTPDQARALAAWAGRHGAAHLDGAAMTGTSPIGRPEAFFLYSGATEAFTTAEPALTSLGRATYLGADPGTASLFDTALLGVNLGLLTGFYHALALLAAAGVPAQEVATVVTGYLPFAVGLLPEHARQVDQDEYPPAEGTLAVLAAAVDHLVATSADLGIDPAVPIAVRALLSRGLDAGRAQDGLPSLVRVIAPAGDS